MARRSESWDYLEQYVRFSREWVVPSFSLRRPTSPRDFFHSVLANGLNISNSDNRRIWTVIKPVAKFSFWMTGLWHK